MRDSVKEMLLLNAAGQLLRIGKELANHQPALAMRILYLAQEIELARELHRRR